MNKTEREYENDYAKLINIFKVEEAILMDNPTISDELLQQSVDKVGQEIFTALEFLVENSYEKEWVRNATIEDLLNEYYKLKQ